MTNTNIPATLNKAALTESLVNTPALANQGEKHALVRDERSYQFPSAPCTVEFQHKNVRIAIPDGVYRTSDPKEIAELDLSVECGNIYRYNGDIISPSQVPPKPIDPTAESN